MILNNFSNIIILCVLISIIQGANASIVANSTIVNSDSVADQNWHDLKKTQLYQVCHYSNVRSHCTVFPTYCIQGYAGDCVPHNNTSYRLMTALEATLHGNMTLMEVMHYTTTDNCTGMATVEEVPVNTCGYRYSVYVFNEMTWKMKTLLGLTIGIASLLVLSIVFIIVLAVSGRKSRNQLYNSIGF